MEKTTNQVGNKVGKNNFYIIIIIRHALIGVPEDNSKFRISKEFWSI